ncbi:MAG: hypothetical protein PF447_09410 [Spirochaetaceae bacterium]|jgi:hypothetical protein|nr:hypothetical protein [Spirochaetaceae bacterium]
MKKILLPLILIFSLPLFAQNFQVSASQEDYLLAQSKEEFSSEYLATLKTSMEMSFSDYSRFVFSARGDLRLYSDGDQDPLIEGDIERLYYYQDYAEMLTFKVGRFLFTDTTGYILNTRLDGLDVNYRLNEDLQFSVKAALSGLTFDHSSNLVKTLEELSNDYILAPSRFIWGAEGEYQTPISMAVRLNTYGQTGLNYQDLNYQTWYTGVGISYPMTEFIIDVDYSYNGGWTQIVYDPNIYTQAISAHLVSGSVSYYPLALRDQGFSIKLSGLYTSGDQYSNRDFAQPGGLTTGTPYSVSTMFVPITLNTLGELMQTQAGNMIEANLSVNYTAIKGSFDRNILAVTLGSSVFLRTADGPIYGSGINPLSNESYLATEIRGDLNIRPLSDLGIKLEGAVLLPNSADNGVLTLAADETISRGMEWNAGLYLSLGF